MMPDHPLAASDLRLSGPTCDDTPLSSPVGFRSVAHVTLGLDCPCCRDRRTKRGVRRTARQVAKQALWERGGHA